MTKHEVLFIDELFIDELDFPTTFKTNRKMKKKKSLTRKNKRQKINEQENGRALHTSETNNETISMRIYGLFMDSSSSSSSFIDSKASYI
jgi:hypothetical protein